VSDNKTLVGEIYMFEAENHTDANHTTAKTLLNRTCLVVGGFYDAENNGFNDDTTEYFYRVDFSTGNGVNQSYMDVLRNHQYIFTVSAVTDYGQDTPDHAFETGPVNIEADVLPWNQGDVTDILIDGQWHLAVSPTAFSFNGLQRTNFVGDNKLNFRSNHDKGWKVNAYDEDGTTASTWITVSPNADGLSPQTALTSQSPTDENNGQDIYILVSRNTGGTRTGWVYISAGRLVYKVQVTQSKYKAEWALSNIVQQMVAGYPYLTFNDGTPSRSGFSDHMQGVYFKWGGLYAFGARGDNSWPNIVFSPQGSQSLGGPEWGYMPYYTGTVNIPNSWDAYAATGDPCAFASSMGWVDGYWRLPTVSEVQSLLAEAAPLEEGAWSDITSTMVTNDGTQLVNTGARFGVAAQYFPTTGNRGPASENLTSVGVSGGYWTSEVNGTGGSAMRLSSGNFVASYAYDKHTAFPVRCVKDDSPNPPQTVMLAPASIQIEAKAGKTVPIYVIADKNVEWTITAPAYGNWLLLTDDPNGTPWRLPGNQRRSSPVKRL
jgi:hypothetical protein